MVRILGYLAFLQITSLNVHMNVTLPIHYAQVCSYAYKITEKQKNWKFNTVFLIDFYEWKLEKNSIVSPQ